MDPHKVKLTLREAFKPTISVVKDSPFVLLAAIISLAFIENMYVAAQMPVMLAGSPILDALFSFGLAVLVQIAIFLPFILLAAFWLDGGEPNGRDMFYKFKNDLNQALLEKKKEVLANAEKEIFK